MNSRHKRSPGQALTLISERDPRSEEFSEKVLASRTGADLTKSTRASTYHVFLGTLHTVNYLCTERRKSLSYDTDHVPKDSKANSKLAKKTTLQAMAHARVLVPFVEARSLLETDNPPGDVPSARVTLGQVFHASRSFELIQTRLEISVPEIDKCPFVLAFRCSSLHIHTPGKRFGLLARGILEVSAQQVWSLLERWYVFEVLLPPAFDPHISLL